MNTTSIFHSKRKAPDYYQKTQRGLDMCQHQSQQSIYHDHLSGTSSWESDVTIGTIFKNLSVNIV